MRTFTPLMLALALMFLVVINPNNTQAQSTKQHATDQLISVASGHAAISSPSHMAGKIETQNESSSKAFTTILTQDFSSTTFPPTGWTRQVVSGPLNWARSTNLTLAYNTLNPTGTSFSNGFAYVNSDGVGSGQPAENCILVSPVINCTGQSYVWLSFNEFFRQYSASTGHVEVSNNGSTWTTVYSAETGLITNQSTANPHFVDINVSAYASNQATFYVRFHWTGNWDYYWVVDDIKIYTRPQYDAALKARVNMSPYTAIPRTQFTPTALPQIVTAWNAGGTAITNVYATNTIYNGDTWAVLQTNNTNTIASIAANATSALTATSYTPPTGTGFYVSESIVHMTQTDPDLSNDTIIHALWVSDSVYARDDAVYTGFLDGSLGSASSEIILGNIYTFSTTDVLTHVEAYVTGPLVGNQAQIVVYNYASGLPTTLLASSNIFTFTTAGGQWLDLPMSTGPLTLNPGTYFFGVRQVTTTQNLGIAYTNNNFTDITTFIKIGTDPFDTLSLYGYPVSMIVHPIVVCGAYKPTITQSFSHVCTGDQVTLTGSAGSNYVWSPGGQTTSAINITTGGTYSVQNTSTLGCVGTSNPLVVAEYPKPSIFLGNDTAACNSLLLNAGSGFTSYAWSSGGSGQTTTVSASGNYVVTVTDTYCSNTDAINVTINPNPTPNILGGNTVCQDDTVTLDAGGGYTSYLWSSGSSTSQFLDVDTSLTGGLGTYWFTVTVTDGNGCLGSNQTSITFNLCTGIEEGQESEVLVYPNPGMDWIEVETGNFELPVELCILNNLGEIVQRELLSVAKTRLNIQSLSIGVYYLRISNNAETRMEKLIIR